MGEHTPGPWFVNHGRSGASYGVGQGNGGAIVVVWRGIARPKSSNGAANARLIAAAPDLLAAAIELVAASDAYEGDPDDDERCRRAIDGLRAAIAKATGEATA